MRLLAPASRAARMSLHRNFVVPHPSQTLSSILSRMRERRRLLFPPLGESWIEGWRTVS